MQIKNYFTITLTVLSLWLTPVLPAMGAATNYIKPGSLDLTFTTTNSFGYERYPPDLFPVQSLAVDAQGRVYVAGIFTNVNGFQGPGLVRLLANGTVDPSYHPGLQIPWYIGELAIQPDQKLLLLGGPMLRGGMKLSRLNPDGSLDPSFPNNSLWGGFLLQPDGRIFLVWSGGTTATVFRIYADGNRDWTFTPLTFTFGQDEGLGEYALQPNGGLLLGGSFGFRRYYSDGSQDYTFNGSSGGGLLCVQSDSRILVARDSSGDDFFRLNADGTRDSTFVASQFTNCLFRKIAVQPDGRILLAVSRMTGPPQAMIGEIYRFDSNGMRDPTFAVTLTSGDYYTWVTSMIPQSDGRVLIGGKFFGVNGEPIKHLVRLNGEFVPVLRGLGPPGPAGIPIELTGEPSHRYAFEISSNLINWSVAEYVTNTGVGTCRFTNATVPVFNPRFYRAKRML